MRVIRAWFAIQVVVLTLLCVDVVEAGGGSQESENKPPPIVLAGSRSVTIRDGRGGIIRLTSIPRSSAFGQYGGGSGATCSFTAPRDDYVISDGQTVPEGTVVTSSYVFDEGITIGIPVAPIELPPGGAAPVSLGPLDNARRTFTVYCDMKVPTQATDIIQVAAKDRLFTPVVMFDDIRNRLQLERPVVFTNPVVDRFGGLVTRYPTWLAIHPGAWRTQRSDPVLYRGLTLHLFAQPRELDFIVDFAPNPDKPSPAYRGIIGCVPAVPPDHDDAALPALPELPEQSEPGPNGACMWTPPGPGTVTITARITYTVTFWANGYTEPDDDYIWESEPVAFTAGELIAVNTDPTG